MTAQIERATLVELPSFGFVNARSIARNLPPHRLIEESIRRREGRLAPGGSLVVSTGVHTGRSPQDKYVVRDRQTDPVVWWGDVNHPIQPEQFERLRRHVLAYMQDRDLFITEAVAGADARYRFPVRVVTEHAWHALFARTMFLPRRPDDDFDEDTALTIVQLPGVTADPRTDQMRSEVFIAIDFGRRLVLIGGTQYAGEIKKSVFTIANYLYPRQGELSMHCSANEGTEGDVALFFGLSGTGKTTLSADPSRRLIGDDEHVWTDTGVFNIEGGCYAKVIGLSKDAEPEIYETTRRFGTVLENVVTDPVSGELDLDSDAITENTRGAYPISMIPNAKLEGRGGHPRNIIMLTADAFGILPPVSKLTRDQAMYHFLSGYTAKVAGTESGVTEPSATFSACFGSPFLPLPPETYAKLLGERIDRYDSAVWLVNTGWTAGPYGTGHRMPIAATRAIIRAILSGDLVDVEYRSDPIFGLSHPTQCPDVSPEVLVPRSTWSDPDDYDRQATELAHMFAKNFKHYASANPDIRAAGPSVD